MDVRPANRDDIHELALMAKEMHQESDFAPIPFDGVMCEIFLGKVIEDVENSCAFVTEKEGVLTGAILASLSPFFFSTEKKISEIALYVKPEYRGSRASLLLEKQFDSWADERKIRRRYLGNSTGSDVVHELYQKLGYTLVGGLYRKDKEF
jgi:GNAT superfamily N-acetyltransferase